MSDVLDRISAMNPVPQEPPESAWTASVLLDEIDARRGNTTKVEETATTPVGSPKPTWHVRIAVAAGAFVAVLAVVGVVALITNDGESEDVGATPSAQDVGAGPDQDVAGAFYEALVTGDRDAAQELVRGVVISGQEVEQLWEIEVVSIDCWDVTASLVGCTSTQTDAVTRQVSEAYGRQSSGFMTVVDGLVTHYTSENQPDPVFDRYEAWLDTTAPGDWEALGCQPGSAVFVPACIAIHIAEVEAWLASGPDLSEIAAAVERVSIAEAFFVALLEGDLPSARNMVDDRWIETDLDAPEGLDTIWGIEIVGIDCESAPAGATVTCVATQIDDLSRKVSPDYTHRITGKITVADGLVTNFEVGLRGSVFERYEQWLDETSPPGWRFWECTHGGWGGSECRRVYLDNFEAWLATGPDLSNIEG